MYFNHREHLLTPTNRYQTVFSKCAFVSRSISPQKFNQKSSNNPSPQNNSNYFTNSTKLSSSQQRRQFQSSVTQTSLQPKQIINHNYSSSNKLKIFQVLDQNIMKPQSIGQANSTLKPVQKRINYFPISSSKRQIKQVDISREDFCIKEPTSLTDFNLPKHYGSRDKENQFASHQKSSQAIPIIPIVNKTMKKKNEEQNFAQPEMSVQIKNFALKLPNENDSPINHIKQQKQLAYNDSFMLEKIQKFKEEQFRQPSFGNCQSVQNIHRYK